ncbi:MAG: glycoside hydrolase, partial [Cellulomonas sp.]|nr:glycoside hydrolase [Cellulomonas sp.]
MSDHIDLTEWWSSTLRPARRKRFAALVLAVALIATTTVVWLSPSVATPGKPQTASAEEVRLSEENTRLRAILKAREQQSADLARSQAKAEAERKAAAEQGAAKAEAEKQAAAQAGQQKAAAERAAAAQRSKAKAASERAAAAARGKAQDRAEQAEAEAARA